MNTTRIDRILLVLIILWGGVRVYGQSYTEKSSIEIFFRNNSSEYDPRYRGNARNISKFVEQTNALSESLTKGRVKVTFSASASPDGDRDHNDELSTLRLQSAMSALLSAGINSDFFNSVNASQTFSGAVPLSYLAPLVEKTSGNKSVKYGILSILEDTTLSEDEKLRALKAADRGRYWQWLKDNCFPVMRSFRALVRVVEEEDIPIEVPASMPRTVSARTLFPSQLAPATSRPPIEDEDDESDAECQRKLTLKTNALGWSMLVANLGAEVDVTKNVSVHIPVYYSALDYFTSTVKFRTIALQPEVRWNFTNPEGLFVGAHFMMAYFNFAVGGDYRIQDHDGNTPMLGGGLTVGYKLHFKNDPRWGVEFSAGVGAYRFSYDKFVNEANGPYVGTNSKVYFGPDNLSVSFFYEFDLGRGARR